MEQVVTGNGETPMNEIAAPPPDAIARFWPKVDRGAPDTCWNWQGAKNPEGYGHFRLGGKVMLAHRFSILADGSPLTADKLVLHCCDNPSCVNPRHLRVGTHRENMAERNMKGRARGGSLTGSRHPGAKLTGAQVAEIRALAAGKVMSQRLIGERFGISQPHVSALLNYKSWSA
jgi:DNA-binding CsgD family transcriptional regulator